MKRNSGLILFTLIAITFLTGCMPKPWIWKSEPETQITNNDFFSASIKPVWVTYGTKSFLLIISNKSEKPIELNWNKTLYISNGQTSGGFMYEGIIFSKRDEYKPIDVIFPKGTFQKEIWPNILVKYDPPPYGVGWVHWSMDPGVNGVYLTTVVDGIEINEKITVNLSYTK